MAKHVKKVRGRTAVWVIVITVMVLAGVSVSQLASATTMGWTTTSGHNKTTTSGAISTAHKKTTTSGATTTTHKKTTTSGATTTTHKKTTTSGASKTSHKKTSTSVAATVTSAPTSLGGVSSISSRGRLPFTGASSLPMLVAGLALLGLGAASLFAGMRRRRA